jgi:type IV pilus assembly protein PilB
MSVLTIGDKRLGAALIELGHLKDEDLQRALERHREIGGSLAEVIVDMGLLSEQRMAQVIEEAFGIPLVNLHEVEIPPEVRAKLPAEKAKELEAIPFGLEGDTLRVAFTNPLDTLRVDEVEDLTEMLVEPYQVLRPSFEYALATNYPELGLEPPPPPSPLQEHELRLGEMLLAKGWVQKADLEQALVEQEKTGELLGRILVTKGLIDEAQLYEALAEQEGAEFVPRTDKIEVDGDTVNLFLRTDALRYHAIPVKQDRKRVHVVVSDLRHKKAIEDLLGKRVKFILTLPDEWEKLFNRAYPGSGRLG